MIKIRDLLYEYRRSDEETGEVRVKRALDGVTLDIERGSFVAIIGPNGSGKSTLAKCLNGLLVPASGSVMVDGMDTSDDSAIWDIRSRVGMVFQNPDNQIVSSIVEDDVAFGPENLGIAPDEIRKRVDEALDEVGMTDAAKKGPHQLSGGQKQRIAIAGAIAMRPDCIIFDEPTAMLDPAGRGTVLEVIKRLNGQGMTVILITHYMEEAARAGRIVVLKDGRIFSDSSPADLFSDADLIRRAGLELPAAVELGQRIRDMGHDISDNIVSSNDLVDAIMAYRDRNKP